MKANEAPEKIYLNKHPFTGELHDKWLLNKWDDSDIEYTRTDAVIKKVKLIDKDALVAEIEKQRNTYISEPSKYKVLSRILSFLDTIEVKEVDDEKCKEYDKALSIAKAWYKSSDSSVQERNVAHIIMGDKVREEL